MGSKPQALAAPAQPSARRWTARSTTAAPQHEPRLEAAGHGSTRTAQRAPPPRDAGPHGAPPRHHGTNPVGAPLRPLDAPQRSRATRFSKQPALARPSAQGAPAELPSRASSTGRTTLPGLVRPTPHPAWARGAYGLEAAGFGSTRTAQREALDCTEHHRGPTARTPWAPRCGH